MATKTPSTTYRRADRRAALLAFAALSAVFGGAILGGAVAQAQERTPLTPGDLALLNRVTWGANASSAKQLRALGSERWLDRQLHPQPADDQPPPAVQAQIDALPISRTPMAEMVVDLQAQNQAANQIADPDQKKLAHQAYQQAMTDLAKQAVARSILRDIYAPDQLREQMTWFWFNHFNVHAYKANLRPMIADYEDRLRDHALGRFRDLLEATLKHPAMLRYLDNADNAANHINENYAREIMELHTMGVDSGYSQKDVQELARILTGVGIDLKPDSPHLRPALQGQLVREGLFEFNPARHDYGDKIFLGHTIKGRGFGEVEEALDILSRQPATARHVSRQLATYFVSDNPPDALVRRMADTFQHTDGDIPVVLKSMFRSAEFKASIGTKFKDPAHYAISAIRLAYDDKPILNAGPIQNWINRMAEGLYNHETPDGYPMTSAAWDGPGQMAVRFEIARQIGGGSASLFKSDNQGAVERPAFPRLQNALYYNAVDPTLAAPTRAALDQAASPQDWNTLFLSSPEFMRR